MTDAATQAKRVPDGWARRTPDSSVLTAPQVFAKVTVALADVDRVAGAYAGLLGLESQARMPMLEAGLLVVSLRGLVVTAAPPEPDGLEDVTRVILVASLDELAPHLGPAGLEIIDEPVDAPPGRLMHTRDADRLITEWIEYRPLPGEQPATPVV